MGDKSAPSSHRFILFLLLGLDVTGCSLGVAAPKALEDPAGSELVRRDLSWVGDSAEYQALARQIYMAAGIRLAELARDLEPGTWAVSLDADETVLSNLQFQRRLWEGGRPYSRSEWSAWIEERRATAVPGAREFAQHVRRLGGKVVIVTNRRTGNCLATRENLSRLRIQTDAVLCRSTDSRKEGRWDAVGSGAGTGLPPMDLVMWLGDSIQDFPQGTQDWRLEPEEHLVPFGTSYFLLPNPMYGSWADY